MDGVTADGFSQPLILAEHVIRYTNERPVPVAEIIESLQGLDTIVSAYLPRAIRELTGAEVTDVRLYVEGFDEGSLIEKTLLCLAFKDEASYELFLGKLRAIAIERFKGSPKVVKGLAVSALIMAMVIAGAMYLSEGEPNSTGGVHVTGDNNTIIQIGAEAYGIDPQAFEKIVSEVTSKDKRRLANSASKVLAPARAEEGAAIAIEGDDGQFVQVVSPGTVQETPEVLDRPAQDFEQRFPDVDLQIRATDRDSNESGWAAVIPGIVDRRVKLVIDPSINPDALAKRLSTRADVTITFKAAGKGSAKATLITLNRLVTEE